MMKMMEINFIYMIIFMMSFYYMTNNKHLLKNLIVIEYKIMTILILLFMFLSNLNMQFSLIFLFMIIAITESIIGISIIISMIRTHNNEFIKSVSLMKF